MSLALLQESAKEVRRLAIAGSALAIGDFRLKKLVPPLEQAGAKVPVFAQVAKTMSDLVNGTETTSAANLLQLSTLLNAILYTQGESSAEGPYRELEMCSSKCSSTRTPARTLKPLVQALTSAGAGRFEMVKSAVERGVFNDLRLIEPAIKALGDNYPELAELVAERILPGYGPGIVPRLKTGLDLKGNKQDARRLAVMHNLAPAETLALCKIALEDGSPEVKAAALACLGKHEDCLPLVLEQANAKNKIVRGAALEALAQHDRPETAKIFTELLKGKTLELLARPFRFLRSRQVVVSMLDEGKRVFALLLKGDSEELPRFSEILDCLKARREPEVEQFLIECLTSQPAKLAKLKPAKNSPLGGDDLLVRLANALYSLGSPAAVAAILSQQALLPPETFGIVLRCAVRSWSPDKVFAEFSPLLSQTKGPGKDRRDQLESFVYASSGDKHTRFSWVLGGVPMDELESDATARIEWDPRWLDAAIKADRHLLVSSLARPGHKAAIDYLLKLAETKKTAEEALALRALARCQYPQVTDVFLNLISKRTKSAKVLDYELRFLLDNAQFLPPADLPKLDAFATKLDEKFVDSFLEAIAPLRPVSCTTN